MTREHFVKTAVPDALAAEAEGLRALNAVIAQSPQPSILVPRIISESSSALVLERIPTTHPSEDQWAMAGRALAQLHQQPQPHYGWHRDNFIGLNPQKNHLDSNWGRFFYECRLQIQVSWIRRTEIRLEFEQRLQQHEAEIIDLLNRSCSLPSLVHGDLWSGNLLFSKEAVWLIDPAVYWADSEVDLAMTELFGGFHARFYQAYEGVRPLTAEYAVKRSIYNLYHALNHYSLFGDTYLPICYRFLADIESKI